MQPSLPTPHVPQTAPVAAASKPDVKTVDNTPSGILSNNNPATAADEDILEKEWVQRLKQIIAQTKHDPFKQEHEISKLQADYLSKRYGKRVRIPEDE